MLASMSEHINAFLKENLIVDRRHFESDFFDQVLIVFNAVFKIKTSAYETQ